MFTINDLEKEYVKKHGKSKQLYEEALDVYPSGVSHDARHVKPFPIYATEAKGTKKWDVDGNEYVDYVMGHGALLFGYGDERVQAALRIQIEKSLHMGASTELEIEWAKLIKKLVPSAKGGLVRPTACGSEAVQMAVRLARIYTGKDKIVIHAGAYHGKQASTIYARRAPPVGVYNVRGIPEGIRKDVVILPFNDLKSVEGAFKTGGIACFIHHCNALYSVEYLKGLRELTVKYGVVLLFDEVVSGFRYSSGGAQGFYDVVPDLTALGKIVGGGVPVGAICGRKDIMELYSFKDSYWNSFVRIAVGGTWNAQPICIAGGIAMMRIIDAEKDTIYPKIYGMGRRLAKTFNEHAEDMAVSAYAYGLPVESPTTISLNFFKKPVPENKHYLWNTGPKSFKDYETKSKFNIGGVGNYAIYLSMMNNGIFTYSGKSGSLCTKYSEEDLLKTENALKNTLEVLKYNELIGKTG
jgi:glutamate-1-semialdehyde 2,1-aminomutase